MAAFPSTVGRAWRSMDGTFDGNSEDEDEYVADAKRQRIGGKKVPPQSTVRLLPRAGCGVITVVATADLHRHHEEHYLANNSLNLAEWFESSQSPAHVDLAVFAGDLGLELEAESTSKSHTRSEVGDAVLLGEACWRACSRPSQRCTSSSLAATMTVSCARTTSVLHAAYAMVDNRPLHCVRISFRCWKGCPRAVCTCSLIRLPTCSWQMVMSSESSAARGQATIQAAANTSAARTFGGLKTVSFLAARLWGSLRSDWTAPSGGGSIGHPSAHCSPLSRRSRQSHRHLCAGNPHPTEGRHGHCGRYERQLEHSW